MMCMPKSVELRGLDICKKGACIMEEKKELSEILLGNNKRSSSGKKAVFVVLAAIAIIVIMAFLMWKFLSGKEEPLSKPSESIDTEIMKPADDQFSSNFGGFDFQQNESSKPDNKVDDIYGGLPQDFTMGFDEQSVQDPQNSNSPTSEIDDALNNIAGSMKPESTLAQSKESAQASKPAASTSTQKPATQASTKDSEQKKPEPKPQPAKKPESTRVQSKESASKPAPNMVAQKPTTPAPAATNGSAPTQGFYWQLGVFEKEPSAEFLALIKKYSYRVQHVVFDNKPNTRYLLGPYKSKAQAPSREEIAEIFKENPMPVEIP